MEALVVSRTMLLVARVASLAQAMLPQQVIQVEVVQLLIFTL
jgi:hypothetical protein